MILLRPTPSPCRGGFFLFLGALLFSACCWSSATRLVALAAPASSASSDASFSVPIPDVWLPADVLNNGNAAAMAWKDVVSCCQPELTSSCSADADSSAKEQLCSSSKEQDSYKTVTIGRLPQFTSQQSLQVLQHAKTAWSGGSGVWTSQMTLAQRCAALQAFLQQLSLRREEMVQTLMWEIGKNRADAESEFDRTVEFGQQLIETITTNAEFSADKWELVGGTTHALTRRGAIGIFLALAPYNYPLNECYATILPALLMGNVVVLKIPAVGGLVHLLTMDAFRKTLPAGTITFIAGSGRATMPPLMETGEIDGLAFIGGAKAADDLIQAHPHPHRLKVFLQLEANNMGIYLPDLFEKKSDASLDNALEQGVLGSLSYNGQRCTAIKLHFVPNQYADVFVAQFVRRVQALSIGLPTTTTTTTTKGHPQITPLPTRERVKYMKELIQDAIDKGARIMNENGGTLVGGDESTLMIPVVLYPVTPNMRVYREEQFGPVVPIATYENLETVLQFGRDNPHGQQVSVFGHNSDTTATIVDAFASVFGRINLNTQCGRSPDTLPFSGRRSSAMGTMSVKEALREFSIPTVIAYKHVDKMAKINDMLGRELKSKSKFLQPVREVKKAKRGIIMSTVEAVVEVLYWFLEEVMKFTVLN